MTYPISSKLMKILFQPPHALDEEDEDRDIAETIDLGSTPMETLGQNGQHWQYF